MLASKLLNFNNSFFPTVAHGLPNVILQWTMSLCRFEFLPSITLISNQLQSDEIIFLRFSVYMTGIDQYGFWQYLSYSHGHNVNIVYGMKKILKRSGAKPVWRFRANESSQTMWNYTIRLIRLKCFVLVVIFQVYLRKSYAVISVLSCWLWYCNTMIASGLEGH